MGRKTWSDVCVRESWNDGCVRRGSWSGGCARKESFDWWMCEKGELEELKSFGRVRREIWKSGGCLRRESLL